MTSFTHMTPMARLEEIGANIGVTPEYKLLKVQGTVHAPTFFFTVEIGDVSTVGQGQSKKKAKHAAAKSAIEELINESDYMVENADTILESLKQYSNDSIENEDSEDSIDTNPVSDLQDICNKLHWRSPNYETISEEGADHERTFKIKCSIKDTENKDFYDTGIGKSKRLAKSKAAQMVLKRLVRDKEMAKVTQMFAQIAVKYQTVSTIAAAPAPQSTLAVVPSDDNAVSTEDNSPASKGLKRKWDTKEEGLEEVAKTSITKTCDGSDRNASDGSADADMPESSSDSEKTFI